MRVNARETLLCVFILLSCSPKSPPNSGGANKLAERPYCGEVKQVNGAVQFSGSARFERRLATPMGLGDTDPDLLPIRYAEIQILSGESVIQCSETDGNGNFLVNVPSGNQPLTVRVLSRAQNQYLNASVLNNPTDSVPFSIEATATPDATKDIGTIVAPAKGNLQGGAFNILDQVLRANDFLRAQTQGCSTLNSGCSPFSVAPKAQIFWTPGVNPGTYFGISGGISFFVSDYNQLFILGGIDGDVNNSDTDHFDNIVILHEYGHFLEHQYSKSDSPGGSHDANSIIDPRLAWSEGWANFFALAVSGETEYRDTYGNSDGVTGYFFKTDLERHPPTRDIPGRAGEGNFREFSISRALWDLIDPHPISKKGANEGANDQVTGPFSELWATLTSPQLFASPSVSFRNYGLFMQLRSTLSQPTDMSAIFSAEKQRPDRRDYALKDLQPGSCNYALSSGAGETGSFATSNQFSSNDFFHVSHTGGTLTVRVDRTQGTGDIDLYIYKDGYSFGTFGDMAIYSNRDTPGDGGVETASQNLPAGNYMINVMLYPLPGPATADYSLTVNGVTLCP